jgi:RNA polymerase sigma factor (sigma-70 family)
VDDESWLAAQFEAHRPRLRAIAYRMLGSYSEADDAVQDVWLRVSRRDLSDVANLGGWLTTVAGRICLDQLRARQARREESLETVDRPDPTDRELATDPESEAVLAESVGLALLLILDTLSPAERLAFVLHDMFAVPFDEIATIVGRTPAAAKMLASRARRRIRTADTAPETMALAGRAETDAHRQRLVVEAFLAASRDGDFAALVAMLDPSVVARADEAAGPIGRPVAVRGAQDVARQALLFSHRARHARLALVNGTVGLAVTARGQLSTVLTFTVVRGKIVEIQILADPERLRQLEVVTLDRPG